MKLPFKCPMCSRTFRTPQGRRGHLTFKHGMGKRSIYTDAIGKLITAHKEGIEQVKKRRRLPRSVLDHEKRRKALELAGELEEREPEREEERSDWFNLIGFSEIEEDENEERSEGISLKGLSGEFFARELDTNLKGLSRRWFENGR